MYLKFLEKFNEKLVISCNGLAESTVKNYFFCANVTAVWNIKNKLINFFILASCQYMCMKSFQKQKKKQKGFYFHSEV